MSHEDLLAQLEERQENPPRLWTPKGVPSGMNPDDCITDARVSGIVEETETREGDYGPYPVVILVAKDKTRAQVNGYGTVLGGRLPKARVGDAVGVTYLGKKASPTSGMQDYDNYDVVILRNPEVRDTPETPEPRSPSAIGGGDLPLGPNDAAG